MGMNLKEGDYIEHLHICSTHDYLLFFTNQGKVYRLKVYELPEGSRTSKGQALVNVLPLRDGERVMAVIPTRDFKEGKFLVFATANGLVKKTEFAAYNTPIRADGIIAIKIRKGDELVQVRLTSGKDDLLLVSKSGHASRFSNKAVRAMGRDTSGVRGMNVSDKGNRVLGLDVARPDAELLVVTENGYGKRTAVSEYPVKGRGTKGVQTVKLTTKKGGLAGALMVREHQDLLFISKSGMVQRTPVSDISQMGRATQGVRVMNVRSNDRVCAAAPVVESGSGIEGADAEVKTDASSDGAGAEGARADGESQSDGKAQRGAKPKPAAKSKPAAVAANGLPTPVATALESNRVVVVALFTPSSAIDELALAEAQAGAKAAKAGFVAVNVLREGQGRAIARLLGVTDSPTLLVYRAPGTLAFWLDGFADLDTVAQAALDARRGPEA
jgi:DNA gyrase subunit A